MTVFREPIDRLSIERHVSDGIPAKLKYKIDTHSRYRRKGKVEKSSTYMTFILCIFIEINLTGQNLCCQLQLQRPLLVSD